MRPRLSANLKTEPARESAKDVEGLALHAMEAQRIDAYFRDPAKFVPATLVIAPPGMPIG